MMTRALTVVLVSLVMMAMLLVPEGCSGSTPNADVTINLTAKDITFDKDTITVPAGATIAIIFDNKDPQLHNFAVYETSSATKAIFIGQTVSKKKITYTFTAPSSPGTYYFRCDVHPYTMTGDFIVT